MPAYAYRAVHASGRIARGKMDAANENELSLSLRESGLELIEAKTSPKFSFPFTPARGRVPPRVLASFCSRMHDLLSSGISFPDALRDLAATTDHAAMTAAMTQCARTIANGGGIAAGFALSPRIFPPVLTAILGAGERSGDMTAIFAFLARYTAANAQTQERLRRALRYPLFLFFVAGGAVAFMMTMVVPQIAQFLNGLQSPLPLATRVLIAVSAVLSDDGASLFAGLTALVPALFLGRRLFPSFAVAADQLLLRLPVLGPVMTKTALARFTRSFSILFRSGCAVPDCLRQARETVGNHALRAGIEDAERRVQAGASLSLALDAVMPPFALGLLRTGERSGDLGKSLDDITAAYDREAQAETDRFIGLLEPSLTLMIGAFLAWTVVATLSPLYGSLGVLGGRM